MDGSPPTTTDQGETYVEPAVEALPAGMLDEAVTVEAAQVIGNEMVTLVADELFAGGRNLLDLVHLARRYRLSEQHMERIVNSGIFPLPILRINGVEPVWLVSEADEWDSRRFGAHH